MSPSLTCAWCNKKLAGDAEVFALNAKIKADYFSRAKRQEGQIVQFHLYTMDRDVPAIISTADSQAKRDGTDLLFPTCSMSCGKALAKALRDDKNIVDTLLG